MDVVIILLLEVRSYSDYYASEPYKLVKDYSNIAYRIVKEGVEEGVVRDDIGPEFIRQVILGGIEHVCLTGIALIEDLCKFLFRD